MAGPPAVGSRQGLVGFRARRQLLDRITINPNQCGGRPCIRGMRIRVIDVLELLAAGQTHAEILADYPYLESDDIVACLRYAVLSAVLAM